MAPGDRVRVAFVCDEYPPGPHGGIGSATADLARALVAAGHRARVVGTYGPDWPGPDSAVDDGVEVLRLRSRPGEGWVRARVRLWRVLRRWAKDREIDLVEVPDWQGLAAGFPPLGVPVVVRCHGSHTYFRAEAGDRPAPLVRAIEALGVRRGRAIVAASEHTWERTRALFWLGRRSAVIVANPVLDGPAGRAEGRDRRLVVFSGTLSAKKGVIRLAEAWPSVLAELPDARLVVAGKDGEAPGGGSMQAHLVTLLGPAAASVRFEGHLERAELFGLLERAGVAVHPSYAEAFGLAPMEALAHGAPTIYTTRRPGPDLLTDGVEALLVDPDDVAALAGAIVALLRDPARADALAAAGRARVVGTYGPAAVLSANLDFWREALR